jgi:DNA-binding FadR family transcriptional regulator
MSDIRDLSEPKLRAVTSRAAVAALYVQDLIAQRGLAPGAFVASKSDLQAATGVARSTVGEALKILQERRIVSVKPGPRGGVFVADPEADYTVKRLFRVSGRTADAMAVRDQLETMVIREAVLWRTDDDVAELRELIRLTRERVEDQMQTLALIWRLHRRIGEITPNVFLRETYVDLIDYLREHTAPAQTPQVASREDLEARRVKAHEVLVDVIERGDPDGVDAALEVHNSFERSPRD